MFFDPLWCNLYKARSATPDQIVVERNGRCCLCAKGGEAPGEAVIRPISGNDVYDSVVGKKTPSALLCAIACGPVD
jgi:hypothetical protein